MHPINQARICLIAVSAFLLSLELPAQSKTEAKVSAVGDWAGTLEAGIQKLQLVLHVRENQGKLTATLDSPDQGATGLRVDEIALRGRELTFSMPRLGASYKGTVSEDGKSIDGTFTQGAEMPLRFELGKKIAPRKRPQMPKPPYPYRVEEVRYAHSPSETVEASFTTEVEDADASSVVLAGTLTLPKGDGPFPAAVLISGSGPQDRDESLMGHKPFLVLADHLTRQGIAVLRYDDRGTARSTGRFRTATSMDFADDAEAGFRFLRTRKEIDKDKIGFIGHSEGGLVAPIVAARNRDVAFLVLMAGPGVAGDAIIKLQSRLMAKAAGASDAELDANDAANAAIFAAIRSESDPKKLREKIADVLEEAGASEAVVKAQIDRLTSPWMRSFLTYDPRPALRKVKCPVLAINGELDLQVDADQNLKPIEQVLKQGGNEDYEIARMPGLNHLFQKAETGALSEYSKIEETINPKALERISSFVTERF